MTIGLLSFVNQTPIQQAFLTPFANNSPWNVYPVSPILGTNTIPVNSPSFGANFAAMDPAFSTGFFYATASDPPRTINTSPVSDEQVIRNVTLPHFPVSATAATGSDGHLDVYDSTTGLIHAFWEFGPNGSGGWQCGLYSNYPIDGTGWGSPSRPGGPRASGIAASAGLLRTWEQDLPIVNHATMFGCDQFTVANLPIFPSTMQDVNGYPNFTGNFHYGTLMMLPPTFDLSTLGGNTQAMAIARTLMKFGCYLVDTSGQGSGGFNMYGEIGSTWPNCAGYNGSINANLDTIRNGLRPVTSVSGWLDRNGNPVTPTPWAKQPLLSMRGPWFNFGGGAPLAGAFNTITNLYEYPDTTAINGGVGFSTIAHYSYRDNTSVQPWNNWTNFGQYYLSPTEGTNYTISVSGNQPSAGNVAVRMQIFTDNSLATQLYDSGNMFLGDAPQTFNWPVGGTYTQIGMGKNPGGPAGIRMDLIAT
jgi:hypothetical protein